MPTILSIDVGIKNLSYCLLDANNNSVKVIDWDNISITDKNCKKIRVEEITECVLETLMGQFNDSFYADVVLIENQPMLKNGLMKTVAVVIYTYFNMLKLQFGNVKEVRFISATNKLKQIITGDTIANKETYKDRKKLSIALARQHIVNVAPQFIEWFENQSKKDDCSDALNQGLYFAYTHILKKPFTNQKNDVETDLRNEVIDGA
jgi:Holliday junction resolvasome RuvABC endonuclease subunit